MDHRLPYEELIAGKLQQLPVPDMQDQIWEKIRFQLDLDMPEDEDPGTPPPAPAGPGLVGWGLAIVLFAFISIFIITKNKPAATKTENTRTPSEQIISPAEPTTSPPGTTNTNNNATVNTGTAGEILQTAPADPVLQDNGLVTVPAVPDSAGTQLSGDLTQVLPAPVDTTATPAKRPRGVQGISPNDYRIVPKKDSVNKQ